MIKLVAEDPTLHDVRVNDISNYLQNTGWKRIDQPGGRVIRFVNPDDRNKPITLMLPVNKNYLDAYDLIAKVINFLAAYERDTPQDIIQKIHGLSRDIIRIRLLFTSSRNVPSINDASLVTHGLRNLLAYAACMEHEHRLFFERILKPGRQQIELSLFGHTFPGSFGFTVETPVEVVQNQLEGMEQPGSLPLERRVTERITRGLRLVQRAAQAQDASVISKSFEQGFNANMCNAMVEILKGTPEFEMEYSITWSTLLKPSEDLANVTLIHLNTDITSYLEEAAHYMEEIYKATQVIENATIQGEIQGIQTTSRSTKTVTVLTEERGNISFAIKTGSDLDELACNAYRDNKIIQAHGTLTKKNKKAWTLVNVHGVRTQ